MNRSEMERIALNRSAATGLTQNIALKIVVGVFEFWLAAGKSMSEAKEKFESIQDDHERLLREYTEGEVYKIMLFQSHREMMLATLR